MKPIRTMIALALIALLMPVMACDNLKRAERALRLARIAQPTFERLLPGVATKYASFLAPTEKLVGALRSGDNAAAKAHLEELIPIFNDIVDNEIGKVQDAATRTLLMAALAGVDIALHELVDDILKDAPPAVVARESASTIRAFQSRPVWGTRYKQN